jgi:predicted transcriptional regulator
MRKTIKLNENDLGRIIKKVIKEQDDQKGNLYSDINDLINEKYSDINPSDVVDVLENILRNSKAIHHRRKNNIGSLTKDEVLRNFRK